MQKEQDGQGGHIPITPRDHTSAEATGVLDTQPDFPLEPTEQSSQAQLWGSYWPMAVYKGGSSERAS